MTPRRNLILALAILVAVVVGVNLHWRASHWAPGPPPRPAPRPPLPPLPPTGATVEELLTSAMQVQSYSEPGLFEVPGVVGVGIGFTDAGRPALKVFVDPSIPRAEFPRELRSFPVLVQPAGPFRILPPEPVAAAEGEGPVPTGRFDRPVPMGVSTGHTRSTAGTIGAVVTDGQQRYALSNWHVFVPGGNARVGDALLQPGPVDGGADPADVIATLAAFEPVVLSPFASNRIDAAIARTDDVLPETPLGGYGSPRSTTMAAKPGLPVQKYGRTTRLTVGEVEAVNTSINVSYGSAGSQIGRFTGQIMVCCNFSQGGDSGSLIVARDLDRDGNAGPDDRKPVALLFAGDGRLTIGNPIDLVLDRFDVTIVGEGDANR
ncbi:hypothetical protein [Candidatus Palauibacter sp.]|uniref:hypothetical protein n=1 Tax=Candidatus Palauibacter sp. TaxID=3101350 RepID=UPI003AF22017